jgi:hypothetical protein
MMSVDSKTFLAGIAKDIPVDRSEEPEDIVAILFLPRRRPAS